MENDEVKIFWEFNAETDRVIVHRRPHIVVLEKEKNVLLIDITVPGNVRIEEKEEEKLIKYQHLVCEVKRFWQLSTRESSFTFYHS